MDIEKRLADWHGDAPRFNFESGRDDVALNAIWLMRREIPGYDCILMDTQFFQLLVAYDPAQSTTEPAQMAIWPNRAARDTGEAKRRRGKPGRMLKTMLPDLPEKAVHDFSTWWAEYFAEEKLTLKSGTSGRDFIHAYTYSRSEYKNPRTTSSRKSLANSCMRYDFEDQEIHPVAAYASGDFMIAWVEDDHGKIAARCVIYMHDDGPRPGPIYGVSESAMDLIQQEYGNEDSRWHGARLLPIPHECNNHFIAPYLDCGIPLKEEGSYLVISSKGDITSDLYEGFQRRVMTCRECDSGYNLYSHPSGGLICVECAQDEGIYCPECREITESEIIGTEDGSDDSTYAA